MTASTRAPAAQPEQKEPYKSRANAGPMPGDPHHPIDMAIANVPLPQYPAVKRAQPVQQHSGNPASTGREIKGWRERMALYTSMDRALDAIKEAADGEVAELRAALAAAESRAAPAAAPELDVEAERREFAAAMLEAWPGTTDPGNETLWEGEHGKLWRAARTAATSTAPAPDAHTVEISEGFFAGCKVKVDPNLPPDTVELRGANRVRLNIKNGEITKFAATSTQAERAPGEAEIPVHLLEFVQEIANEYTYYDQQESICCGGCGADLDDKQPHVADCIVLRAKALLSPHPPVGAKEQE